VTAAEQGAAMGEDELLSPEEQATLEAIRAKKKKMVAGGWQLFSVSCCCVSPSIHW
jgi:hypothetical protein